MPLTYRITETMTGTHHFIDRALGDGSDRPCWFRVTWGSALRTLVRDALARRPLVHPYSGVVNVEGLTRGEVPCEGTLSLDYWAQRITYDLAFDAASGERCTMIAEKLEVDLLRPLMLVKTHTTAYASIRDGSGRVVSRAVLHFRPETLGTFARSLRLSVA